MPSQIDPYGLKHVTVVKSITIYVALEGKGKIKFSPCLTN
jgi:hypothetical protein